MRLSTRRRESVTSGLPTALDIAFDIRWHMHSGCGVKPYQQHAPVPLADRCCQAGLGSSLHQKHGLRDVTVYDHDIVSQDCQCTTPGRGLTTASALIHRLASIMHPSTHARLYAPVEGARLPGGCLYPAIPAVESSKFASWAHRGAGARPEIHLKLEYQTP